MLKDAVIDGNYRFLLLREWDDARPRVLFIMLNPSTADDTQDDNTIKRCIGFAQRWRFGSLEVANLFAYRATKPAVLKTVDDPVGQDNYEYLFKAIQRAEKVILAWGNHVLDVPQVEADDVMSVIADFSSPEVQYYCLGLTDKRQPKHPLLLPYDTVPRKCMVQCDETGCYVAYVDDGHG